MDSQEKSTDIPPLWKLWKHKRYLIVFLLFLGTFNVYALRVNMSVGVVAMTQDRIIQNDNGTVTNFGPIFPWTSQDKGLILSSFFYGYVLTQFVTGYLCAIIPCCWIFSFSVGTVGVLTLLTPLAANAGLEYLIGLRILIGLLEGGTYPSFYAIISRWSPKHERTRMNALSFSGMQIGTIVGMSGSGLLANQFGWESIFYGTGLFGCISGLAILILVSEEPGKDKHISMWEVKYIQESIENISFQKLQIPWKSMLTSSAVLAIFGTHFCENWGHYTFLTQLPMYLNDVLKFNLVNAGFLAAAPYLAMTILIIGSAHLGDFILGRKLINRTMLRKIYTCMAFVIQIACLCLIPQFSDQMIIVALFIFAVGSSALAWNGFGVSFHDVAPQYSSIIMGISNTFASMPGILSPILAGYLVQNKKAEEWQVFFYISCGIFLVGLIIYGIFGNSDIQPWALQKNEEVIKKEDISKPTQVTAQQNIFDINVNTDRCIIRPEVYSNKDHL